MAKPITRTTPLEAEDAESFLRAAIESENFFPTQIESKKVKDSLDKAFKRFEGMKIIFNS